MAPQRTLGGIAPCKQASRSGRTFAAATERAYCLSRGTKWSVDATFLHILQGKRELTVDNPFWGEGNHCILDLGFKQITNGDPRFSANRRGECHLVFIPHLDEATFFRSCGNIGNSNQTNPSVGLSPAPSQIAPDSTAKGAAPARVALGTAPNTYVACFWWQPRAAWICTPFNRGPTNR
jgi:hypothetical protein